MPRLAALAAIGLALSCRAGAADRGGSTDSEASRAPPPSPLPAPPLMGERPGEVPLGEPPAPEGDGVEGARRLPFREERDGDGSRFLWFLLDRAGIPCEYLPASEMLASPRFEPIPRKRSRPGDVAWWKGFAALYRGERPGGEISTAAGRRRLVDLEAERGPARFLRLLDLAPLRPAQHALTALGRAVRWANPDPGAWAEDQPRQLDAPAATLSLRRRPLREPGGGQVSPAIVLWVAGNRPGAPVPSLGIPAEARVVRVEDAPGGARRLVSFGGEEAGLRALTLAHLEEGLVVAAACTGSATTWRVLERECRAFLDSLAVEPAR